MVLFSVCKVIVLNQAKRTSDNKEFTFKKSRFSADDQKYFEVWGEKSNVPKGRRLKEIITDKYLGQEVYIGGTTGWKNVPKEQEALSIASLVM